MTSLLDSVATGAIQPGRAPDVLPDRDALRTIIIDRLAGDMHRNEHSARLPRVGATAFEMAARYRDLVDAGLHEQADAMLDAWACLS